MEEKFALASRREIFIAKLRTIAHIVSITVTVLLFLAMIIISILLHPAGWFR
jgi:hypothetical protein